MDQLPFSAGQRRILLAAQGYLELGLYAEAHHELNRLDDATLDQREFLECRLFLFMQESRWKEALEMSEKLRTDFPEQAAGYLQGAYCLHEMKRTTEARDVLQEGPDSLRKHALYYYNMGCYEAVLGNDERAREMIQESIRREPGLIKTARRDEDLQSIRAWLELLPDLT